MSDRLQSKGLDKKGFTLLETIVTIVIVSIVMMALYTVFNTSLGTYRVTSERIDAQSQFRLLIGILDQEVGTAARVELLSEVPESVPAGAACIYVVTDGSQGTFYKKTVDGAVEYNTPHPLRELSMTFKRGTSQNVLDIHLHAKDINEYNGSILVQNAEMIFIDVDTDYSVVYYEELDLGL